MCSIRRPPFPARPVLTLTYDAKPSSIRAMALGIAGIDGLARALHILGVCAVFGAGALLTRSVCLWSRSEESVEIRNRPGAIQVFAAHHSKSGSDSAEVPPLVVQAELFARFLNSPKSEEASPTQTLTPDITPARLFIRPATPSVNFRLYGTSCYRSQPNRSMALISEMGAPEGSERWVKEGAQLGHFVIHEIRQDGILYRDGDQLRKMAVEPAAGLPSLAQAIQPGSRKVSAAIGDVGIVVLSPAGPNNVGIAGN